MSTIKPQFTPKPWKALIRADGKYFPSVQIGPLLRYSDNSGTGDHKITVNKGQPPGVKHWSNTMEACNANARLIAAAPEMFEVLTLIADGDSIPVARLRKARKLSQKIIAKVL